MKMKLTKKQKAYIEGIVYIIAIIVVIFAKVYGSIYFSLLPLLVILGIVGKVFFDRGVVTTIFGIIISLCVVYTKGSFTLPENIIYSLVIGLDIAMGELLGDYLKKSYAIYRKRKDNEKKLTKKQRKTYILAFVIFILTAFVNTYTNGSIYSYNKAYKSLKNYLNENYESDTNFRILNCKYSFGIMNGYNFNVLDNEEGYITKYSVYLKDLTFVKDEYKEIISTNNNIKKSKELKEFLDKRNLNEKYKDIKLNLNCIDSGKIEISLEKKVDRLDEEKKKEFSKEIVDFLEDIKEFKEYSKIEDVLLNISEKNNEKNSAISNIYLDGYNKNIKEEKEEPYIYILKSLSIEYIDAK